MNEMDFEQLEFAVFCIENIALRLQTDGRSIYDTLTLQSNLLPEYIIPAYDVLHTQGKNYIVDDLLEVMKERGLSLDFPVYRGKKLHAHPVLMQMKYARVIDRYAKENGVSRQKALQIFYHSSTYQLMREGVSDLHCMSDQYLVQDLQEEQRKNSFINKQA